MNRPAVLWTTIAGLALAQSPGATVVLPGYRTPVWMDTTLQARSFHAPAKDGFDATAAVLDSLAIPVGPRQPAAGIIGNGQIRTQRRFAGQRMSRWLDCGGGAVGPTADVYQISLALLGMLRPAGSDSTELRVVLAAGAQDFAGPLGDPISCSSSGALEERILGLVARRLERR